MPACKKTVGCIFLIPADEKGPCGACAGFGVIAKPDAPNKGSAIACTTCLGAKEVKLVDNKNAQHAGPCMLVSDCVCDKTPGTWATLAEQFRSCEVHGRRATPPGPLKDREEAMAATSVMQLAADATAYAAKIDAAVVAKRWEQVPEPRKSIEMAKVAVAEAIEAAKES